MKAEKIDLVDQDAVLVLMASRNGEQYILHQISTLLAQSSVRLQVLVRDDNSTDRTRELVAQLAATEERVRLWPEHAAKGSAAANFFELILKADVSGFNYVAFCDQDDEWHADKLERAVSRLRTSGAVGYSAGVEAYWPDGRRKQLIQNIGQRAADYLFEGAGQGCTFVMTGSFFKEVQETLLRHRKLLESIHYHDWTVYAFARAMGRKWYIDDTVTMAYRQHSANDTGARGSFSGVKRRVSLIADGWYRKQVEDMTKLVLALNPEEPAARSWQGLSSSGKDGVLWRIRRIAFVASKGRRRLLDRIVLMSAIIFGYL